MANIRFLSVENVVSRRQKSARQTLSFLLSVENLGYGKQVDVVWAGEDGIWQVLPARYVCKRGDSQELWQAQVKRNRTARKNLPGAVRFALRLRVNGEEYWDNNQGWNYDSPADSGIKLARDCFLAITDMPNKLGEEQKLLPITIATGHLLRAEKVSIHWTTDHWHHSQITPCVSSGSYWQKSAGSAATNPGADGVRVWTTRLKIGHAFKIHFCLSYEVNGQTYWDNNGGSNYTVSRKPLTVMILNLHCYQEDNQDFKFSQIARAIGERQAEIVCLQEVAEHWNGGAGDWASNAANIINSRLPKPYHLITDWSHLGFDKYREGVAILSRFPLLNTESRYVSESQDAYNIHSRKVVMAQVDVPYFGLINLFSAHLSWLEDGFAEQFGRLHTWAASRLTDAVKATLLCGDFNVAAGSAGYRLVVENYPYTDQFLAAITPGLLGKVVKVDDVYWRHKLADDYRIDFVFMDKADKLQAVAGEVLFTEADYGRVSDHCGYLLRFEPVGC
jgi:maltose 6'-phosphate phosphatase